MGFAPHVKDKVLDKILRGESFSAPATIYVSLHSDDPGSDGSNEIDGGSYVRKEATFTIASDGYAYSEEDILWNDMPEVEVTHVGIWDDSSTGDFWWGGSLLEQRSVVEGDSFLIPAGDLSAKVE